MTEKTTAEHMLEVKGYLLESLKKLNSVWDDMGLLEEHKSSRVSLVFMYIKNVIDEMVAEEETRRSTLKASIQQYKEELSRLCDELHVAPVQPTVTRLYEVERELKQSVTCWQNEKDSRLSDLKELKGIEQALCDIMHTTPMYIPSGAVPTKDQLSALRKHTDGLATEKMKRYEKLLEQRDIITRIIEDIGHEITTEFEQDVVIDDLECFILSEINMTRLSSLTEQLQEKQKDRVKEMDNLREELDSLWNRLDIIREERNEVLRHVTNHTPASIDLLKEELERCKILKYEHLQEFTLRVREELQEWWDKCHYSKTQRASFSPFHSDEYTEELLAQHEAALEAVKQFYRENEQMLRKIEKRTELWNQMVAFDVKENDPNRFKNRGGNLLAEEKEKKKVMHQLPKVEEQLKNDVEVWEKENGRQFLIGGVQFFEYCRLQWEEYKMSKELQKQQRLEQKEKEKQTEIRFGSKPTPSKRRFGPAGTPSQTPKQRKLNDTTRSATHLHTLSKIHSVFTSPVTPSKPTRTPLRQAKTTSNLHAKTPQSTRRPPVSRTPSACMSSMAPPRTPMSTRSTARKIKDTPKAKSCASLASPKLKTTKSTTNLTRAKSERKLNRENTSPPSVKDEIVSQSSQSGSDVGSSLPSYEEFENVLHSSKKTKQYRSTICPPK